MVLIFFLSLQPKYKNRLSKTLTDTKTLNTKHYEGLKRNKDREEPAGSIRR